MNNNEDFQKNKNFTLALDFDGVIHQYSNGWMDGSIYDEPVPGALEFINIVIWKYNWSVFILSTRDPNQIKNWFDNLNFNNKPKFTVIPNDVLFWNEKHNIGITNRKLPAMLYVDDRAWRFDGNFLTLPDQILNLRTWQDKE